jgi:hypothetical protein
VKARQKVVRIEIGRDAAGDALQPGAPAAPNT